MFAPTAIQDISFPTGEVVGSLDGIPKAFTAWDSYSSLPTGSSYTTESIETGFPSGASRWGYAPNGKIFGIVENSTTGYVWDTNTNTLSSGIALNAGALAINTFIRRVIYNYRTNRWVVLGSTRWISIDADTNIPDPTAYAMPANGSAAQYSSAVGYNGFVYAMPLTSTSSTTKIVKIDVEAKTSSTIPGSGNYNVGGKWGAVVANNGKIYFCSENSNAGSTFVELDPMTDEVTAFGNLGSTVSAIGYQISNLPDGRIIFGSISTGGNIYFMNPDTREITSIPKTSAVSFGLTGLCIGQSGHYFSIEDRSGTGISGIFAYDPKTNAHFQTQYPVQRPSAGDRGFQDLVSLPDGRLCALPGQNNSGRICYYTYLENPNPNITPSYAVSNPIQQNGGGL